MAPIPIPDRKLRRLSNELSTSLVHGGSKGSLLISLPMASDFYISQDDQEEQQFEQQATEQDALIYKDNFVDHTTGTEQYFEYPDHSETTASPAMYGSLEEPLHEESQKDYTTDADEVNMLVRSAFPMVITFLLQNSLSVASIFSVGHLGKRELAAISLASMTTNITGFAVIQGLSTCLDTLCCQAYGAKKYHLVGVYFQRCVALVLTIYIPVCFFWWFLAEPTLNYILPKKELGDGDLVPLAVLYLKVVSVGVPGYILFETGKRFLQAQGIFHASTYILLICAPLNGILNYLLVWNSTIGIGYLGAPLSIAIVDWCMAIGLFVYTVTTSHNVLKCWGGLNVRLAFRHWSRMFHLALNGLIMVLAEFFAFEVLTIYSSYLGIVALDANSVVSSISALTYQIPFAVAIAGSTRLAYYVGAGLRDCANTCARLTLTLGCGVAVFNCLLVFFFKLPIARLFTSDEEVISRIVGLMNLISVLQIFDALNAVTAGILRGQGMQHVGSVTGLFSYYVIGLPLAYFLTFKLQLGLEGLWIGTGLGLMCISFVQVLYSLGFANWDEIISQARKRTDRERNL